MATSADFDLLLKDFPDHAPKAWADVAAQLKSESATFEEVNIAKSGFTDQLRGLTSQLGAKIEEAAPAAALHTLSAATKAGCIEAVGGLVASVSGGIHTPDDAAKVTTQCVGVMVSIGIASGIATAGVGAAIIGVVGGLSGILAQAGLFGKPVPGVDIPGCPGMKADPPPNWVVGCLPSWGSPVASAMFQTITGPKANPDWIVFPEPGSSDKYVRAWFDVIQSRGQSVQAMNDFDLIGRNKGNHWYGGFTDGKRAIDYAFPAYAQLIKETPTDIRVLSGFGVKTLTLNSQIQALFSFRKAYLAAWKKNAERGLNGQKMSSDEEVLAYVLKVFNRANASAGNQNANIHANDGTYIGSLIPKLRHAGLTENYDLSKDVIVVFTGGPVTVRAPSNQAVGRHMAQVAAKRIPVRLVAPMPLRVSYEKPFPIERTLLGAGGAAAIGFYVGGPPGAAIGAGLGAGLGYLTGRK